MLSADSLISGHHVFTPGDEGELPPSASSPKKEIGTPDRPMTLLWTTLHTISSIPSLIPKALEFAKAQLSGKMDPLTGVPLKRLPSTLKMLQRIISAIWSWQRLQKAKKTTTNAPQPIAGLPREEWPSYILIQLLIDETMNWLVILLGTVPAYQIDPKGYVQQLLDDHVYEIACGRVRSRYTRMGIKNVHPECRKTDYKNELAKVAPELESAKMELMKL